MTDVLAIVSASTAIAHAMRFEMNLRPDETCAAIAAAIETATAAAQPLDATFVALAVWDMTRDTQSQAYRLVMPSHSPLIAPNAAARIHPDDLAALSDAWWSASASDIPSFTLAIEDGELSLTTADGQWVMRQADRSAQHLSRVVLRAASAAEAIAALAAR